MYRPFVLVIVSLLTTGWWLDSAVRAQPPGAAPAEPAAAPASRDALAEHFFSPGLIIENAEKLGLSSDQRSAIEAEFQSMQVEVPLLQEQLQKEVATLADQIKANNNDEQTILAQVDVVLNAERDVKRMQLVSLLRVRNQLSSDQQMAMKDIRQQQSDQQRALGQRLQQKIQRVQIAVQRLVQQGQQPTAVIQRLQPFQGLMQQGKFVEAEALVDEALAMLGTLQ